MGNDLGVLDFTCRSGEFTLAVRRSRVLRDIRIEKMVVLLELGLAEPLLQSGYNSVQLCKIVDTVYGGYR